MSLPYRADHIGSFLRPKELLDARERGVPHDELKAIEDREILRVLAKQKELGFGIFTDGELRRAHFMSDLTDAVDGFDMGTESQRRFVAGTVATAAAKVMGVVTGKIKQHKHLTADELPFLKANSPGPIKMTLPSATQFPANAYKKGISDKVYPTMSDFLADVTKIIADETKWLAEQGVAYIQIDAPRYSYYVDPKWRDWLKNEYGRDPDELLDEAIAADNAAFRAARRPGVTLGDPSLPREQPQPVVCRGRLRSDRREDLQRARSRSFPARIRRPALGRLPAAALRPAATDRRARVDQHQSRRGRERRRRSSSASRTPPATSRSRTWRSARSAASPRWPKATSSPKTSSGPSSSSPSTSPNGSGAKPSAGTRFEAS